MMLRCPRSSVSASATRPNISSACSGMVSSTSSGQCAAPSAPRSLSAHFAGRLKALIFDGKVVTPELHGAIGRADAALAVSMPPDENGDPVLRVFGDDFAHARRLAIDCLSFDESAFMAIAPGNGSTRTYPAKPGSPRSRERLDAEQAWQKLGARRGIAVAILRLAGIYGPGQNALEQIARGKARSIVKAGQVFNRIHVDDIAQAIDAAFAHQASGIFNVADDEPTPPGRADRVCRATHGRHAAAGTSVRGGGANYVAYGVELLAGVPPRAQQQAEERTWRQFALSDLSRGLESIVCAEMTPINECSDP